MSLSHVTLRMFFYVSPFVNVLRYTDDVASNSSRFWSQIDPNVSGKFRITVSAGIKHPAAMMGAVH